MDLPPSGWYPDPYGMPELLRWWDGAAWTDHTYAEPSAPTPSAEPATTAAQPVADATRIDPGTRQAEATRADPGMRLAVMGPPTGPRTAPQPAIPDGYAPNDRHAANKTQIFSVDDPAWAEMSGGHTSVFGAGGFGDTGFSDSGRFGQQGWPGRDERRRKILIAAGLTGGVAAACAVVALVLTSMNSSPQPSDGAVAAPVTETSSAPTASSAPSATPSASPSATVMSSLTDSTSGLTYGQLPAPWGPGCPGSLNPQAFSWAAGESAVAGQANNGQTTWYGVACSGQLPAQYGYSGTADLQNVTSALANAFNGAYYAVLPHNFQEVQSQPVSVSGYPGWEVKFLQTYTSPQPWTNELGAVVVADPGNGAAPAVFYVSVPGNLNEANVDTLVSSLQLTPTAPQPSATVPAPGQGGDNGDHGHGGG